MSSSSPNLALFVSLKANVKIFRHFFFRTWPLWIAPGCIALLLLGGFLFIPWKWEGRFFPNVSVAAVSLDGMTVEQGRVALDEVVRALEEQGLTFEFEEKAFTLPFQSEHPDIAGDMVWFDADTTLAAAFRIGREPRTLQRLTSWLGLLGDPEPLPLEVRLNEQLLNDSLSERLKSALVSPKNARFVLRENGSIATQSGEEGRGLDFSAVHQTLAAQLKRGQAPTVSLVLGPQQPEVLQEDLDGLLPEAGALLRRNPHHIRYQNFHWQPTTLELVSWLSASSASGRAELVFGSDNLQRFFSTMEDAVNAEPTEPKFQIENGKVSEFQIAHPGRALRRPATAAQWTYDFILAKGTESTVIVDVLAPKISKEDVPMMGIEELIGVGESDFTGSPTNRRHNIHVGADRIHGTLIAPDEEFSLLSVLGDFGPEDGWLPELVIKENRTVPEYGGGACQFGTTMFRGAMNVGLPIAERRNHSYTVSYYYPIGTDATIYDPAPDLRFQNDTGNYILIQSTIEGNKLRFEFWGRNDGRVATQTDPVLTNWVNPPATKLIESTDLPVGERKCIERSHKGVSATFDYQVRYADGRNNDQTFSSKYKPWQEVCLLGVEKLSSPPDPSEQE